MKQGSTLSTRLLRVAAASGIVLGVLAPGAAAFAADYPNGGTPPSNHRFDPGGTEVKGVQVSKGSLPFTGGDVAGLAAIGGGAAAVGGLLVMQSRRRRVSV